MTDRVIFTRRKMEDLALQLEKAKATIGNQNIEIARLRQECAAWEQQCKSLRKNLRGPNKNKTK